MTVKTYSSLEKIFAGSPLPAGGNFKGFSLLKGERGSFQLAFAPDCEETRITVKSEIPVSLFKVGEIYSSLPLFEGAGNCAVLNNAEPGFYPDLLTPFEETVQTPEGKTAVIWAEADSTGMKAGVYPVKLTVKGKTQKTVEVSVRISGAKAGEQTLKHINWFHSDCLSTYYGVPVFSEDYWRITENFVKNAVRHGVNCLLTPLFTPPLDTEVGGERPTVQLVGVTRGPHYKYTFDFSLLDRWVDMGLKNGIKHFELSHLFTQWGAKHAPKIMAQTSSGYKRIFGWETNARSQKYKSFLLQFAPALKEYTDKKGITDICYVHVSDEPGLQDINSYRYAAGIVHSAFSAYTHIDALSDFAFYEKGLTRLPVPQEGNIEAFYGRVPELWTYYCCGQFRDNLPNRFFCLPSVKNRILGTLLYKYGCSGFLQWGFNFYYTQHSVRPVNPFEESDAGGAFPSGDSFVVYPGENGEPLSSLRQKVFYDGFQDYEALKLYEKKHGRAAALKKISDILGDISFTSYPLDSETLLKFAEEIRK